VTRFVLNRFTHDGPHLVARFFVIHTVTRDDNSPYFELSMNESAATTKRKHKRRWKCFSLRTTLILTATAAICLGWIDHRARQQKAAVEWMVGFDRRPLYDFDFDKNGKYIPDAEPPAPAWLRNAIGIDYLASGYWKQGIRSSQPENGITQLQRQVLMQLHT